MPDPLTSAATSMTDMLGAMRTLRRLSMVSPEHDAVDLQLAANIVEREVHRRHEMSRPARPVQRIDAWRREVEQRITGPGLD